MSDRDRFESRTAALPQTRNYRPRRARAVNEPRWYALLADLVAHLRRWTR